MLVLTLVVCSLQMEGNPMKRCRSAPQRERSPWATFLAPHFISFSNLIISSDDGQRHRETSHGMDRSLREDSTALTQSLSAQLTGVFLQTGIELTHVCQIIQSVYNRSCIKCIIIMGQQTLLKWQKSLNQLIQGPVVSLM